MEREEHMGPRPQRHRPIVTWKVSCNIINPIFNNETTKWAYRTITPLILHCYLAYT